MNKITKKSHPSVFEVLIQEGVIQSPLDTSYSEHRKGRTFFVRSIIEIKGVEGVPDEYKIPIELYGYWETNTYVTSDLDTDWCEICELTRVDKHTVTETITKEVWKPRD